MLSLWIMWINLCITWLLAVLRIFVMWKTFWKVFHLSTMIRQVLCILLNLHFGADITRICTHLRNTAVPLGCFHTIFPFAAFMVFFRRALLTSFLFFVKVKALKQRVDFSVPNCVRHTICPIQEDRLCGFYYAQKSTLCFPHLISILFWWSLGILIDHASETLALNFEK